jgi:hypothetical protein
MTFVTLASWPGLVTERAQADAREPPFCTGADLSALTS